MNYKLSIEEVRELIRYHLDSYSDDAPLHVASLSALYLSLHDKIGDEDE
jgi:hypothetical protein